MTDPRIETLAREFSRRLIGDLGEATIARVNAENARRADGDLTCASHEYCDANEYMLEAFEVVTGRELIPANAPMSDEDSALVNAAWSRAKQAGFFAHESTMRVSFEIGLQARPRAYDEVILQFPLEAGDSAQGILDCFSFDAERDDAILETLWGAGLKDGAAQDRANAYDSCILARLREFLANASGGDMSKANPFAIEGAQVYLFAFVEVSELRNVTRWLASLESVASVEAVRVTIGKACFDGARYVDKQTGDSRLYLLGEVPASYRRSTHVCYNFEGDSRDWYIAYYMPRERLTPEYAPHHPFGPHFGLFAWSVPDGSRIDSHEEKSYARVAATLETKQ